MASPTKLVEHTESLLGGLDSRSRDIINRRFGLTGNTSETLDSIGKQYGITRERVRQIESQAKKTINARRELIRPVAEIFAKTFSQVGGLLTQSQAVRLLQQAFAPQTVRPEFIIFYLEILPDYTYVSRHNHVNPHWRHKSAQPEAAARGIETAHAILEHAGHPLPEEELLTAITRSLPELAAANKRHELKMHLEASKHIHRTPFGEWGLLQWPETKPRGVGEKAYAVLRRHGKPEHFTRITELINQANFDAKRANAQTVHNELIKDKRFVLVGRGLYGLSDWGYVPGTVADVLESVLAKAPEPMARDELIKQVLAQRQVKKNTILLGLQDTERFVKTGENRYTLKRS